MTRSRLRRAPCSNASPSRRRSGERSKDRFYDLSFLDGGRCADVSTLLGHLNPGVLDHLRPMRDLGIQEVTEIGGRAANRFGAKLADCFTHVRLGERFINGCVELTDDLDRRPGL